MVEVSGYLRSVTGFFPPGWYTQDDPVYVKKFAWSGPDVTGPCIRIAGLGGGDTFDQDFNLLPSTQRALAKKASAERGMYETVWRAMQEAQQKQVERERREKEELALKRASKKFVEREQKRERQRQAEAGTTTAEQERWRADEFYEIFAYPKPTSWQRTWDTYTNDPVVGGYWTDADGVPCHTDGPMIPFKLTN